jgi:spermidine/putrescine transport system substrate-binding protein
VPLVEYNPRPDEKGPHVKKLVSHDHVGSENPNMNSSEESISLDRRNFLTGATIAGATSVLGASAVGSSLLDVAHGASTTKTVRWANWGLYLDFDNKTKTYPTLEAFKKKTGINAIYQEAIDDNDSFNAKVAPQMRIKKDIGYDIVTLTEWMAQRWIASNWVRKFDPNSIPNKKNLIPALANRPLDPTRQYSLPWAGVIAGLAWRKKDIPQGLRTLDDLFSKKNKGRIEVLSEMRDTVGLIMLHQGVDISKPFSENQFMNALDFLQKMIKDGFIRQIKGQSYAEDMISGDAIAVIGWSGDINQLNLQNGNQFGFAIPDSGGTFSSDNMMIPATSPNAANAEALINYYYDPVVSAKVASYITYVAPVKGAQDAMMKFNPAQANNPLIFPTDEMWKKLKVFRQLTPMEQASFSSKFQAVSGKG